MNYFGINQTGTAHQNGKCEDAVYISNDETVFCLADGVSNSRYGSVGAEEIVNKIGRRFKTIEYKTLLKSGSVEEIRKTICHLIEMILDNLCLKYDEKDRELFASTFIALIKTDERNITLVHAGDGAIFGQPKTTQRNFATILSYPDNDIEGKVYSVGNPEQINRMRVIRIKSDDYNSIMMCTDGFSEAYLVPSFQAYNIDSITDVFKVKSDKELKELVYRDHICKKNITDDISCIICKIHKNDPACKENDFMQLEKNPIKITEPSNIKDITIPDHKKIHTNIIEYYKNRKNEISPIGKKKANIVVPAIIIVVLIISVIIGVYIKEVKNTVSQQNADISSIHEQISVLNERLNELKESTDKDNDLSETALTSSGTSNSTEIFDNNIINYSEIETDNRLDSETLWQ